VYNDQLFTYDGVPTQMMLSVAIARRRAFRDITNRVASSSLDTFHASDFSLKFFHPSYSLHDQYNSVSHRDL
jgi:hypothetical protein